MKAGEQRPAGNRCNSTARSHCKQSEFRYGTGGSLTTGPQERKAAGINWELPTRDKENILSFMHGRIEAGARWCQPISSEEQHAFYGSLRLANGTFRTTSERRLDDLNAAVIRVWQAAHFSPRTALDVGVSSGTSTVEWLDAMLEANMRVRMTGSDLVLWADLRKLGPFEWVEANGHVLRQAMFGRPFRAYIVPADYLTGRAIVLGAAKAMTRFGRSARCKTVPLLSKKALASDVEWIEEDMFAPGERRFDVIRVANLLNLTYFPKADIERAIRAIAARLNGPRSRLIVCRTLRDGSNHGAMYRLDDAGKFRREMALGDGSEIDDLVTAQELLRGPHRLPSAARSL